MLNFENISAALPLNLLLQLLLAYLFLPSYPVNETKFTEINNSYKKL